MIIECTPFGTCVAEVCCMLTRSVLAFAVASMLFACTMTPDPAGSTVNGASTGNKTTKTDPTDQKTDPTTTATAGAGTGADGTWDVTSIEGSTVGPSTVTIKGGQITGTIVGANEGQVDFTIDNGDGTSTDCTVTKNRVTITVTITGDSMKGTFVSDVEHANPDVCGTPETDTTNVVGTRTHAAANANGQTAAEGSWVVSSADQSDGSQPIAFTIAGLAAQMFDSAQKDNKVADITVKSGAATGTGDAQFAARKQ